MHQAFRIDVVRNFQDIQWKNAATAVTLKSQHNSLITLRKPLMLLNEMEWCALESLLRNIFHGCFIVGEHIFWYLCGMDARKNS